LPVDKGMLASLLYIYTNGDICHLASTEDKVHEEIEIYIDRLIGLTKKAKLLFKPPYTPAVINMIDELINLLHNASPGVTGVWMFRFL